MECILERKLDMEKFGYIYPGTVFTAQNYDPFTKKVLAHPFVCVYNQALDTDLSGETNILALLITSNNKQSIRQVPLLKSKNSFLDKDSYCYCNNIYMFPKSDIAVIGQLDSDTFYDIVQKRQMMLRGENDQCVKSLMNMRAYEYKKSEDAKHDSVKSKDISSSDTHSKKEEPKKTELKPVRHIQRTHHVFHNTNSAGSQATNTNGHIQANNDHLINSDVIKSIRVPVSGAYEHNATQKTPFGALSPNIVPANPAAITSHQPFKANSSSKPMKQKKPFFWIHKKGTEDK
jgi:hypothetical protein